MCVCTHTNLGKVAEDEFDLCFFVFVLFFYLGNVAEDELDFCFVCGVSHDRINHLIRGLAYR